MTQDARTGTSARVAAPARRLSHVVSRLAPPVVVVGLLVLLIPLGTTSTIGAVAALGLAILLLLLVTAGIESTGFLLLLLGFLLAPMDDVRPSAAVSFLTASDLFLFLGIGTLLPILMQKGIQRQAPFLIGAAGVFIFGLVTSAASAEPAASLNGLSRLVVGALVLPIVFMLWRPGVRVLVSFALAFILGNCISVVHGVATGLRSFDGRYIGLTQHPNVLGLVTLLGVALVPFLWFELPNKYRWVLLVAGGMNAYGIWMSGSRAAILVTVAVVVLYLLLSRSIEHAMLLFGLSIVPTYLVTKAFTATTVDTSPLGRLRGGGSASASDQARETLLSDATERFLDHPILGNGFAQAAEAHNIYIQVAGAGGVIGLTFYLLVLLATIRQPLLLGQRYILLALPAMAYALIGPLTPLIWDRYIWCVLALPFLVLNASREQPPDAIALVPGIDGLGARG